MKLKSYFRLLAWSLGVVCYFTWVGQAHSTTTAHPVGLSASQLQSKKRSQENNRFCSFRGTIQSMKEKGSSLETQVFYEILVKKSDCGMKPNSLAEVLIPGSEVLPNGEYRFAVDFRGSTRVGDSIQVKAERVRGVNTLTREPFHHWVLR